MTERRNFSFEQTPSIIDTEYVDCNFTQAVAHTRLFPGDDTPRTFIDCNLKNCDLGPGSTRDGGLHGHSVRDPVNDETVTIDGVLVHTQEAYAWEKVT